MIGSLLMVEHDYMTSPVSLALKPTLLHSALTLLSPYPGSRLPKELRGRQNRPDTQAVPEELEAVLHKALICLAH